MSLIRKYSVKNSILKHFIKFYWLMESDLEISIDNKLLPVNNTDIIINYSEPVIYEKDGKVTVPHRVHFNGIRNRAEIVKQKGKIKVFGISFYPHGIYPLLKVPLREFTGEISDLGDVLGDFSRLIADIMADNNFSVEERIRVMEEIILEEMDYECLSDVERKIFDAFYISTENVKKFCEKSGINIKYLERLFSKYTGVTPKIFSRITRFQRVSNEILYSGNYHNLTELAYDGEYYDQAHFIKEFREFSGVTPGEFLADKKSNFKINIPKINYLD